MRTYNPKAPTPRPEPTMRVLNLGAGTQSTAVALMALDGELPAIDAAVFADTGWEPQEVYDHVEKLRARFDEARVPLIEVTAGDIREDALADRRSASLPLHTENPDGSKGFVRRQCTQEYKIAPIKKAILGLLADRLGITAETWRSISADIYVEQVFGISADEAVRARTPSDRWAINYYPLLDLGWRRHDTIAYLQRHGWDAPRSACIGCPFHSDGEWRRLRDEHPDEWADAVEFDAAIRTANPKLHGRAFLHRSLLPLAEVDLRTPEDAGQMALGECEGVCWT